MQKYLYLLLFFVFASHGMEKKFDELRKPRSSSTPPLVGVAAIAMATAEKIYLTYMPRLLDNKEKAEAIIAEINLYYETERKYSDYTLKEIKKKFVETYANKLGSRILRSVDEPEENVTIYYDQRSTILRQEGNTSRRIHPLPTSPWNSLSFEELLKEFSRARKAELHYASQGKSHGPLWTSNKPNELVTPVDKLLAKEKRRFSWHLGNR